MEDNRGPQIVRGGLESQRALDLVLAIDQVRDTLPEPSAMLAAIVELLTGQFRADVCQLCLLDHETGAIELKAMHTCGVLHAPLSPAIACELGQHVMQQGGVVVWAGQELHPIISQLAPSLRVDDIGTWHVAGIRISLTEDRSPDQEQPLGALLLARSSSPFSREDLALLRTAESQIDSAVTQVQAYYELQQRNLELETIYRIDRIRDQNLPFDEMLHTVLKELCAVIRVEMGFIMLYNRARKQLEIRAATHNDLYRVPYHDVIDRLANQALLQGGLVCDNDPGEGLHAVMCIPLILHNEIIGVLGVVNRSGSRGFGNQDRRLLGAIASQMDTAIFESLERVRLRQVLGRSVDPRVMQRLLANPDVGFLKGERSVLSVLYADIRGSTSLAERTDPELLVGFINSYLSRMTEVIFLHEGTLDKFVGDEVMALFGAPFPQPDHALRAVRVGLEMQKAHQEVMEYWRGQGVEAAPIGIGIATGELIMGEMGSAQRSDYTVIGRAANLGARICAAAKAGQVLISQATYDLVAQQVEAVPITGLELKGVDGHVTVYHVTRILKNETAPG